MDESGAMQIPGWAYFRPEMTPFSPYTQVGMVEVGVSYVIQKCRE